MRDPLVVLEVAERDYATVLDMQRALVEEVAAGRAPPTLLVCEHDPVVTIGTGNQRLGEERRPAVSPSIEALAGRPLVPVERGGGVTAHGPGQVVGYPIVRLEDHDVRGLVRALERGLVAALAGLGLAARAIEGRTGVWVGRRGDAPGRAASPDRAVAAALDGGPPLPSGPRKIASIGIAVRRWTSFHGFALNVCTPRAAFHGLEPCGFDAAVMTSLDLELGRPVALAEARPAVVRAVVAALEGREAREGRA
jgi:lipoyl(octanoyl) transferase